jgi:hypothetical protein
MQPARLEDVLRITPFIPFDISVQGKTIAVGHPELVLFNKDKTFAVIVPNNQIHIVKVDEITDLTPRPWKRNTF